jgi:hypothetical protein
MQYIKNFCPKKLNTFVFLPSVGASGGIIIIWNYSLLNGELHFQNNFSLQYNLVVISQKLHGF